MITVSEGRDLVARLREAIASAPVTERLVISSEPGSPTPHPDPPPEGGRELADVSVVGLPVTDTCKEVVDGVVRRTIPRDALVDVRGLWTFGRETLMQALDRVGTGAEISTMIDLCRAARLRVRVLIRV